MNAIEVSAPPAAPAPEAAKELDCWSELLRATGTLSVDLAVVGLTVRELYRMVPGALVATPVLEAATVPVRLNGQLIAFGEFQVVGERLAVRIAEIV
jgi:flagellar motor switch/type III secretory pathway protein FliN